MFDCIIVILLLHVLVHLINVVSQNEKIRKVCIFFIDIVWGVLSSTLVFLFSVDELLSFSSCIFILAFLTISFMDICIANKKHLSKLQYFFLFTFISVFYLFNITSLFGVIYYAFPIHTFSPFDPTVETVDQYISRSNKLMSIINEFNAQLENTNNNIFTAYFLAGAKKYFVLPDPISLKNPHFIQYLMAVVVNGTIIAAIFDCIKSVIKPCFDK